MSADASPQEVEKPKVFQEKARWLVYMYITNGFDKSDPPVVFTISDVYVVWSCKVLQNWKALVSSTLPDGMYYEVTSNGDKNEIYIDAYKKVQNVKVTGDGSYPAV